MAIAIFAQARTWLSTVRNSGAHGAFWPHPPAAPQYDCSSLNILVERYLDARKAALDKTIRSQKHAIYVLFAIGLLSALAVIALMAGMSGEGQTAAEAEESATALGLFLVLTFGAFWYWKKRERVSHELEKDYFDLALTKFEALQWRTEAPGEELTKVKELRLREKLFPLYRRLSRLRIIYYTLSTLAILAVLAVPTALIAAVQFKLELDKELVLGLGAYAFAFAFGTMWARTRMKIVRDDITQTEVAIDMLQFAGNDYERRAENLIRVNEIELRRYYDINSGQAGRIFWVGVLCIAAGFLIVSVTLWFLLGRDVPEKAVWPAAIVGTICALLPNFVGAIYMKLHGETASALTTFHGRLVDSHRLFLANLIASRLENSQDRDATLKELALRMVGNDHAGSAQK